MKQSKFNPTKYLLTLDPRGDRGMVTLPKIGEDDLKRLLENDSPIVIAHDWFSQGCYEKGVFVLRGGKAVELKTLEETKIVNENGEFIFELGSLDHKGLIAIEVPKGMQYFVMKRYFEVNDECNDYKENIILYFEPESPQEYIDEVVALVSCPKTELEVVRSQWLSLYADDYVTITETLPTKLI